MKKFIALTLIAGNVSFVFVAFFLIFTDYIKDVEILGTVLFFIVVSLIIVLTLGSYLDKLNYEKNCIQA